MRPFLDPTYIHRLTYEYWWAHIVGPVAAYIHRFPIKPMNISLYWPVLGPTNIIWIYSSVLMNLKTLMNEWHFPVVLWGQFLHGLFFKMIYVTLIVSSNGPGDVSSCPLLLGLFWRHFLPPNFLAGHHTKVAIHSVVSLSLPLSPLRQQSCVKTQTIEQWLSHVQGGCIARMAMSSPTGTEEPHKRTVTTCSTSAPTFR
jgi:hypothetical protein